MNEVQSIEDAIYKHPLSLLQITDEKVRRTIDKYLPFSTGFEIECRWIEGLDQEFLRNKFNEIPSLMDIDITDDEQRFRIPPGLNGLICLYNISEKLRQFGHITNSGIHYHVDMTDWYFTAVEGGPEFIQHNEEWILKELDTWNYTGSYNPRAVDRFYGGRKWVRFKQETRTCEIRIGEMTFDYQILVKRIIHANKIVRRLKGELFKFKESIRLIRLEKQLKVLEEEEKKDIIPEQEQLNSLVKKRNISIYGRRGTTPGEG